MWELVFAQILVCGVQFIIATSESIRKIFVVNFLFNAFNLLCYYINGDMATVYLYIVICVRSAVYIYRDRIKKYGWHFVVPLAAIAVQTLVGFTAIDSLWQLIPIVSPCYVNYYLWFYDNTQKLRIGNMVNNGLWGIYNGVTGLYIIAAGRAVTVIMNLISYLKHRKTNQV